jgi:hypothetical protein
MDSDPGPSKLGQHGGRRIRGQRLDNISLNTGGGTSRDYIIARLQREECFDLVDAILTRKISAYAVAVELGWVKRRKTLGTGSENQARKRAFDIRALIG